MRETQVFVPGEHELAGVLCLPEAATSRAPAAGLVLLGGTGADNRDGDLAVPRAARATDAPVPGTLRQIAHDLAANGVASLRYDRRGHGGSQGDAAAADYATDLADAVASVGWLRSRPEIDGERVAVAGHSAGALTACHVCRDVEGLAAAAFLGALASPIEEMLRWNVGRWARRSDELSEEQRRWLERELAPHLVRSEGIEDLLDGARRGDASVRLTGYGLTLDLPTARLRQDLDTSYAAEFRHVRCPALVLHGGADLNVPVEDALVAFGELRGAGGRDVELVVLPRLDHYFTRTAATPAERFWDRVSLAGLSRPMSADALRAISRWAVRVLGTATTR
ncbi:MAG TPA: alpha/beta fold hydrolase [Candidatus Dormibacteraeota bacterium]|nr:alpha/beta fold hydrolase [Candidatus Dormibacteraeota bacterium]